MFNVLFWNLNGKDLEQNCARLVKLHDVTVLVLAECMDPSAILRALNPKGQPARFFVAIKPEKSRVEVFSTVEPSLCEMIRCELYYTIEAYYPKTVNELLVCSVHYPSKRECSDRKQDGLFRELAEQLRDIETERRHSRTLLIGDLNADPFQYGVYASDGLHAVSSRMVASRGTRRVNRDYTFFYNPMWRFLGDHGSHPPGSHYWRKSEHDCLFWYLFDQVLLRPSLLPYFHGENLAILTSDGEISFTKEDGRPDPRVASDHFPILIGLDYPGTDHEQHDT